MSGSIWALFPASEAPLKKTKTGPVRRQLFLDNLVLELPVTFSLRLYLPMWLPRRAGSSGISWSIHSLMEKTLHRHRAGFKPQRASSFMKSVKASQILGEAVRALNDVPSLCATLYTAGGVGELYQRRSSLL